MNLIFLVQLMFFSPLQDDTIYISPNKTVILKFAYPVNSKPITGTPEILMTHYDTKVTLSCEGEFEESNLYVETDKGHYSFVVLYKPTIKKTVYLFGEPTQSIPERSKNDQASKETKPNTVDEKTEKNLHYKMKCAEIMKKSNGYASHGMIKKGMEYSLNDVYVKDDVLYFKVTARNTGNIKYDIDFYKLVVKSKKGTVKKEAVQDIVLKPVYVYNDNIDVINGKSSLTKVFVIEKFTIADDKKLSIELWEKNGDRVLEVSLNADELIKAKQLQ